MNFKFSGIGIFTIICIFSIGLSGILPAATSEGHANAGKDVTQFIGTMRGPAGIAAGQEKIDSARITYKNGYINTIGSPANHYFPVSNVVANDSAATAKNFIAERGTEFGIKSNKFDFTHIKSRKKNGRSYERFQQTYSQLPVFGGEMIVQLNTSGGVEFASGDIMREAGDLDDGKVSTVPTLSADNAGFLAIELMKEGHRSLQFENTAPQLMIYKPDVIGNSGPTRLVWRTVVKSVSVYVVDEVILIDASSGEIALHYTQIKHVRNRQVYDSDSTDADPGTLVRSEGDPVSGIVDVDNCYDFLGDTYNFYFNEHGRDGIDGAGMIMSATVRYCPIPEMCPFLNAYWDGARMVFGEGFTVDDVTAHELTHGVTQYESNLIYLNESGAINESFSDMWGEWVDLTNTGGNDNSSVRWLMGEDIGAIRNMKNPPQFGDPDSKCSLFWYDGTLDNGGVHWNSGVGNKLCYLLTDGDTFKNVEITGMGISAVADLMYEVQTNLLTEASNYADFHAALTQAAINLGWSEDDKWNLEKACLVMELSKCFDPVDLVLGIIPDPMEWEADPNAVGETTIFMKAVTAQHASGVEYYIDCETDPANFDNENGKNTYGNTQFDSGNSQSGWVSDTIYYRGDYVTGAQYYFRVRARNLENQQETKWSEIVGPITPASGLAPYPNPAQWLGTPRKAGNGRIAMEGAKGYSQATWDGTQWVSTAIQYFFDCTGTDDPLFPNPNALDSGWQDLAFYQRTVSPVSSPGHFYKFNIKIKTTEGFETAIDPANERTAYMSPPSITREVPTATYPTIQRAINASNHGDTVLVHPGIYREININFKGKAITVKSENPEDPAIVAATVIDCQEPEPIWGHETRRAFLMQNGEGRNSVLAGITIKNATAFDEAAARVSYPWFGIPDRNDPIPGDGTNALGGAILMGTNSTPVSPTIRNCVFVNCFAHGGYGGHGANGPGVNNGDGNPGDRGGHGGNAWGGAIYVYAGSSPFIKNCEFTNCQAIGGDAGNGGNGSDAGEVAGDAGNGRRGGDGGDAGSGGCAWGGAIYFESNCVPELYNVTVQNCLVQVGEAGYAGDGGAGGDAKDTGVGGIGGNGGIGGDLRASSSSGGAIFFGDNANATIVDCAFGNCRVVAQLAGDYSGGDGGNGGEGAGDGMPGGDGGHGGPAFMIPPKMQEIGGVDAIGGTGGDAGNGPGGRGVGGNGGFRHGQGGAPGGYSFGSHTGIFPSNMYYMAYYWEDTANIDNPQSDPNEFINFSYVWKPAHAEIVITTPPADPAPGAAEIHYSPTYIFDSPYSPYFGTLDVGEVYPGVLVFEDPNNLGDPDFFTYDISGVDFQNPITTVSAPIPLTPPTTQRDAGACAGANYYGINSIIKMKNTTVSGNNSFANHGGAELYDKGCDAVFQNCTFEGNQTLYGQSVATTDYIYEGFGGAIFADQPVRFVLNGCTFTENYAYSGGAIYCNFAPSDSSNPNYTAPKLDLTGCTFTANQAISHYMYSYGGAVYAGNSLNPYEEYYFNYLMNYRFTNGNDYENLFLSDPVAVDEFYNFTISIYDHYHGYVAFYVPITTQLWWDVLEADHILWGLQSPVYSVPITGCTFEDNMAPFGGGLYLDASIVEILPKLDQNTGVILPTQFTQNTGEVGAGAFIFASDVTVKDNLFHGNIGTHIVSLGSQSDNGAVDTLCNGGGLYVSNSNLDLINNRFASNSVDGLGGAAFVNGPSLDWSTQSLVNNLFVENVAGLQGGALTASGQSDVLVKNCDFVDNSVLDLRYGVGGSMLVHDAFVDVVNSIFWNNKTFYPGAPIGPQIAVGDSYEMVEPYDPLYIPYSTVFVDYSDVQGGQADIFVADGEGPWLWYGSHNIEDDLLTPRNEADPLFVSVSNPADASERTFYLSEIAAGQLVNSPCLNKGTGNVSDLVAIVGYNVTTRTDHVADVDPLNLGYHYDASLSVAEYVLETNVKVAALYPYGTLDVTTEPNTPYKIIDAQTSHYLYKFKQGTVVQLLATPDPYYRVKHWIGTDDDASVENTNQVMMSGNELVIVEFELAIPRNLYVPESYDSIEDALLAARDGDRIILAPRQDVPYLIENPDGINFGDKNLVITSIDPNDPLIIAQTIIDCQGSRYISKRAFHFENGQTADSVIQGITIQNAFSAVIGASGAIDTGMWPMPFETLPDPAPPMRALSGEDGTGDSYGGAILCENGSSPLIRNCVFKNCTVSGGIGGDGENGLWPANMIDVEDDLDSQSGGHSGKGTGNGYGGAIAILSGSEPNILNCIFEGNRATGGWGGIPGNAGRSYNAGRYGWGGNDYAGIAYARIYGINPLAGYGEGDGYGGAVYIAEGCRPVISQCEFTGNYARTGYVSDGGNEGGGGDYAEPWDGDPWGEQGMRDGRPGYIISEGLTAGGAVYFEKNADAELIGCSFIENQAYEVYTYLDTPVGTRGGAIFIDENATVKILPGQDEQNSDETVKSVFKGNLAGAIYCSTKSDLFIEEAQFTQNVSTLPVDLYTYLTADFEIAGAITIDPNAATSSKLVNCQFQDNVSLVGGGAIRTFSDIELTGCVLSGNQSQSDGGAIYSFVRLDSPNIHTTRMTIDNCEFSGNSSQGLGGALFVKNVILTMNDSFVVMNKAFSGGGVRVSYGDFTMLGCIVYGNEATGAIAGAHRTVTDEGFGGGLNIVDTPFFIQDTRIQNNIARGIIASGGGLCVTGSQANYQQSLRNCLLADNLSDNTGGGMSALLYANVTLDYCTLANNTSGATMGGALYIDRISNVNVRNAIVSGNKGVGIYAKTGGITQASNALFNGNQSGDVYSNGVTYSANSVPGYTAVEISNPEFAEGPLGKYYLDQEKSPAVNHGSTTAFDAGLDTYTTDAANALDTGIVDLGYHYPIETRTYHLGTSVVDDAGQAAAGTITPASGMFPRGTILELSADIGKDYFLFGWSGGTFSDSSQEITNTVLMSGTKDVKVLVRLRRMLNVGTSGDYDILADAITDAQDGDIILVAPGEYTAASQFPTMTNAIVLEGKKITISGYNPNDEAAVRATVFRDIRFIIGNVNNQTIIEGITIDQSRMLLLNADMVLRNCVFRDCRFSDAPYIHLGDVPAGTDGYSQPPITGGALELWDSSPRIFNCTFEDNRVTGIRGENGFGGAQSHPTGGDGGWPGGAYGGAVYCGFSSSPDFIECTFTGNEVFGNEGGNGADGWVDNGVTWNGGRGGGWVYDEAIEEYLKTAMNGGWDGWTNNAYGDKYGAYSIYSDYWGWYNFYGAYDLDVWAKWFNWSDYYTSWDQFEADYLNDPYDPLGDPYDQMVDVWRHSAHGGAVFCESESNATFTKCVFENNQSHGGLTGIGGYLLNDISRWPDRRLNMLTAGGAVFAANDCDLVFTECQFRDNIADIGTVELPHTFQVSFGGAVAYKYDCTATFTDCDLNGNTATVGGGVYGFETSTKIADCNVYDNEAYVGGGVYSEDYDLVVSGTTFRYNHARTPAALQAPAESLDFTGTAGGLFAMVDTLSIRDSIFVENLANISGGGLLLTGVVTSPSTVFNCLFADNISGRDGAGASVNWSHRAGFGNCTFSGNASLGLGAEAESFGGNLAVNYDSTVSVIDSILWGGSATKGRQFAVTSGYVDDARPSTLTISYSDVQGGRTSAAGRVEDGCTLNWDSASIITVDPLFVDSTVGDYHLSQIIPANPESQTVNSPCLNAGSNDASVIGLDHYTTATPVPQYDYGKVDLGYHYLFELNDNMCRYADLKAVASGKVGANRFFDGIVDTGDLYILAAWWLTETCNSINLYCDGVDMTNSEGVDFLDFIYLANCWQIEDTEKPSQVEWNQEPVSGEGELFATMSAVEATDNWGHVMYKFENVTDPSHTSPWRQNYDKNLNTGDFDYVDMATDDPNVPWKWVDEGLLAQTYTYRIYVRDPHGNTTTTLLPKDVSVGLDYNEPRPLKPMWEIAPHVNSVNTIRMVAQVATDPEGNGVLYSFSCAENAGINSGWIISNEYVTPTTVALVVGQTYTFRVKYRDDSTNQNESKVSSDPVAVLFTDQGDFITPETPIITSAVRLIYDGQIYHVVTSSEPADVSGVEYQFECTSDSGVMAGAVHVPWININNMVAGIYPFGDVLFPNSTLKSANKIFIPVTDSINRTYRVRVRDRSPNQNTTVWSLPVSTF